VFVGKWGLMPARTHGATNTPEFHTWMDMLYRCYNSHAHSHRWYGAIGITVCARWRGKCGFENFMTDMGKRPFPNAQIDRKRSDRNYCPSNCRWVTPVEQGRNQPDTRYFKINGERLTVTEIAKRLHTHRGTIWGRIKRGVTTEHLMDPLVEHQRRCQRVRS